MVWVRAVLGRHDQLGERAADRFVACPEHFVGGFLVPGCAAARVRGRYVPSEDRS